MMPPCVADPGLKITFGVSPLYPDHGIADGLNIKPRTSEELETIVQAIIRRRGSISQSRNASRRSVHKRRDSGRLGQPAGRCGQ